MDGADGWKGGGVLSEFDGCCWGEEEGSFGERNACVGCFVMMREFNNWPAFLGG